jgi:hypothetical protein
MMRVSDNIEFLNDPELFKKLIEERKLLEGIIGRPMEPITQICRINQSEAFIWTLMENLKESGLEHIYF